LAALAADPDVAYIAPDRALYSTTNGSPTAVLDYHTDTVNAPVAWAQGLDGTGIGVAVIDSGIIDIPDLHGQNYRVVFSQNFVGGTSGSANDQYGHGSHVAGIIGGNGNKSTGSNYSYTFKGIAPNVNLINLRVLDQNGISTDSQVIAAIQAAIKLRNEYNIRVINLSLGRPVYESYALDPLCQAVENAWKAGIVVVVAAGNEGRNNSANTYGYATITAPGNDPYVITVGAMKTIGTPSRADDQISTYSSKGPTAECHEHGRTGGERGSLAATEPQTHTRSSEGAADEDSLEDLPALQQLYRSSDRHYLFPDSDPANIGSPPSRLLALNNCRNLSASGSNCSGHHRDTFSAAIEWHFGSSK
jgi:serine protease AprX